MMKMLGVILVVISCGSVGFSIAASHRREEKSLRNLIMILDFMVCELQYRLTPLPELCRQVATEFKDIPGGVFAELSAEMECKSYADSAHCMSVVLKNKTSIPPITRKHLELLGKTIGRFDLEGQIKGLDAVRQECSKDLILLSDNRENRLRSYQTLGLCAGAALAILFV